MTLHKIKRGHLAFSFTMIVKLILIVNCARHRRLILFTISREISYEICHVHSLDYCVEFSDANKGRRPLE